MTVYSAVEFFELGSGIVTLCGSTKFFQEYMEATRILTFQNWIVLACGSYGHSFHKYAKPLGRDFTSVKKLHFHKILESQSIVVVSDDSKYIGNSTKAEIAFAEKLGIPVFYYDGIQFTGFVDCEILPMREESKLLDEFLENYEGDSGVNDKAK